jgi:hypothetical protein
MEQARQSTLVLGNRRAAWCVCEHSAGSGAAGAEAGANRARNRQGGAGRWGTPSDKVRPCGAVRLQPHGAGGGTAALSPPAARWVVRRRSGFGGFGGVGVANRLRLRRRGRWSELGTEYENWERDNRRSGERRELGSGRSGARLRERETGTRRWERKWLNRTGSVIWTRVLIIIQYPGYNIEYLYIYIYFSTF